MSLGILAPSLNHKVLLIVMFDMMGICVVTCVEGEGASAFFHVTIACRKYPPHLVQLS